MPYDLGESARFSKDQPWRIARDSPTECLRRNTVATMPIWNLISDVDALLALEPEELAGVVLQHLVSVGPRGSDLNRYNFGLDHTVKGYPREKQEAASKALMEAWVWLEREGLLAPRPGDSGDWVFITRRGERVASPEKLKAYRQANRLPKQLLHPIIAQKVWASFLRGDYDTAVFQSFKEGEVRVRDEGGFAATDVGVDLMRKAFKPGDGPLADSAAPRAEQEALMHLMAGAVGSYKNPHSHRNVVIEASEAVEMIILASHLTWNRRQTPELNPKQAAEYRPTLPRFANVADGAYSGRDGCRWRTASTLCA